MPLFRRRKQAPERLPARAAAPGRSKPAQPDDTDWRTYDRIADDYARFHAPRMALPAADLVALAGVGAGQHVLDVGTGTGVAARAAAGAGAKVVVGIDLSTEMLAAAVREGGGPHYAAGAAIDLPFRDHRFDVVLANFVLSHFSRYETALFDLMRVIRTGGRMGVTAWGSGVDEFSLAWREVAESFGTKEIIRDAGARAIPWDEYFSDPEKLKEALYGAGLREIRIEKREYRFDMTAEDYLSGREITATGRFLRDILGEALWDRFRSRSREVFAERFPPRFYDFRDVVLAVGRKPA